MTQGFKELTDATAVPVSRGDYMVAVTSGGNAVTFDTLKADGTTWEPLTDKDGVVLSWSLNATFILSLQDGQFRANLGAGTTAEYAPHFTKRL